MIYITKDERNENSVIEYHCVLSKKKFKKDSGLVKLKLYDPITNSYNKQIVYIVRDSIEFSPNQFIYKIQKIEKEG